MAFTIATFLFFTILVAVLTWWTVRGSKNETDTDFFLAGRSLTGAFIAGSLLLTNLSTEQLIGLNAGAFKEGLSVMAWEVIAGCSLVVLALFFLPRYLKAGIATIPQFFEDRYGGAVRTATAILFIVAYMLVLLPFTLYTGATGLIGMLDLATYFPEQTSELTVIWTVIIFVAAVGGAYAIFGGLKAVAVSDTFNGVGLLIGGLLITVFSWQAIMGPDDTVFSVVAKIKQQNPDAFKSLGKSGEDVHWPTLFSGVLLLNFFYWCSNQQIIQRAFAAKNLAEGQKGVLIAAFFKILAPFALVLPGIIAAYLVTQDPEFAAKVGGDANKSYGALVSKVLPEWLIGFFAAVVVGAILSTFNSVLNSAATLFSLDVYKRFLRPTASMKEVVFSGQACSLLVGVLAVVAAPLIFHGQDSVFGFFQKLNGVYFIPLLAIMMVGLFHKWADGRSALITFFVGLAAMSVGTFATWSAEDAEGNLDPGWVVNWFGSGYHFMGVVFLALVILQVGLGGSLLRRSKPYEQHDVGAVDLTPWKLAPYVGAALVVFVLGIYFYFAVN